jgi:hypothetical protein
MTLIIAGYNNSNNNAFFSKSIFFASDTAISSGNSTLLCGFRKVYPVAVKLWEPYFIGEYFKDYLSVYMESECAVAFAGNTLTAQHILNSISGHLANLRISISYEQLGVKLKHGRYVIVKPCESNELIDLSRVSLSRVSLWAEDMFTRDKYKDLLTADYIAETIEHSINHAVCSARKYKLNSDSFNNLLTDFAAGIRCPITGEFYLYVFRMQVRYGEGGVREAYTSKELIANSRIAVLGLKNQFEAPAQAHFDNAKAKSQDIPTAMFEYLNEAIDIIKAEGRCSIDRPSILKIFDEKGVRTIQRRPEDK